MMQYSYSPLVMRRKKNAKSGLFVVMIVGYVKKSAAQQKSHGAHSYVYSANPMNLTSVVSCMPYASLTFS